MLDRKLSPQQKGVTQIYAFTPYDYGPFDSAIYTDAEVLARSGQLEIYKPQGQSYKHYKISADGRRLADQIAHKLDPAVVEYARSIVKWTQGLSFNQLVSAVYKEFPDMKVNSVFRG
ncbi:hypothetical protein [Methylibium sp. T29]|uniref:hypothetical protein n=1 Tax=Methylibium sp. T29 TaxID=1430884 RepID=UPI0004AE1DCC|nr:hypothetical protein [Methylibium sp. T29]